MDGNAQTTSGELPRANIETPSNAEKASVTQERFTTISPELKVAPSPGSSTITKANDAVMQAVNDGTTPVIPIITSSDDDDSAAVEVSDANDKLIEKEWVDKAKDIVARTSGDPHAKSKELTILKTDYIQKRYGKHIARPKEESS